MRLGMWWRYTVVSALVTGLGVVGLAPAASADTNSCGPWSTQQDMADSSSPSCRSTWIVDPGQGNILTRAQILGAAELYGDNGFSRRWLWYAPQVSVTLPGDFGPDWTSCPAPGTHVNGICSTSNVQGTAHSIVHNFRGPVAMDVLAYHGNFIPLACGNFGMPLRPQDPPTPKITGHKFDDRNADGVQQPDEPALPGWTFRLVRQSSLFGDQDPGVVDTQTTGDDGRFTFELRDGAGPGTYRVEEVPQDDWAATTGAAQTVVIGAGVGDATVADLAFGNFFQAIVASGTTLTSIEGLPRTGTVATFTDPDPNGAASEYAATVDWGDGATTSGTIAKGADGTFTVTGTHTYAEEGHATVTVTITDTDNPRNTATVTSAATVDDAPLTAAGRPDLLSTDPVSGLPVATFTDANPAAPVGDFTATIDWGDGSPASPGTVSGPTGGPFTVAGSHTYGTLGPKTITTHIVDEGGSTATAVSQLLLFAYPAGGNFVIGDVRTGTHVTFWDAQWAKTNTLSTGAAPADFKGFVNNPEVPSCGGAWTSRPGNSSNPPSSVPNYMALVVSSHVNQSGSTLSGDIQHVVIVHTDPGYADNPGHAGTGEVVATLC
jgi:hypothetical protein